MSEATNSNLQAEAAAAILRRITELAPEADPAELSSLGDAYACVASDESEAFDPTAMLRKWGFDRASQYVDFDVVDEDDEDDDERS